MSTKGQKHPLPSPAVCLVLGSPQIAFPIVRPSPALRQLRQKISSMPPAKLSAEQARTQVRIHLREAKQELLKHGHEIKES